ncbi:MAG: FtsH protease activity modulator HflK [Vicinamibacterales bacterium]|jgi:membrane protease subunit HflK|nr:FtsH protease activity modulator HflK [Acidobacteriota bacterium]MDP6371605.1 FtsH protease activity modulator HflK [Vicinamibacterales bacterium]MDP6610202.1 FtsH protease activity modulator HflK [Vicinamibacterales bacterium]
MDQRVIDIGGVRVPPVPTRTIGMGVLALVIVSGLFNTLYQIQPEEVGVVLRFGRYVRTSEPGLRAKLPFAETVLKVPVQRQLKQEFGFRTVEAGVRSTFSERQFADEAVMLTGDLNVAVVEWIVQYRVSDPYEYLFKVRNLEGTFGAMNEAVMREVVGDRTVTEVLTVGRQDIETQVEEQLQALVGQYEMGITVEQVVLQDVNPPDPVKPSWDEVNQAQQQRDRLINEARAEYNAIIPRARGEAQQAVLQAEGYALDRVNRAQGDAARFTAIYDAYRQAPEVTRRRLYLETMQRVLPQVGGKLYLAEGASGVLPLLSLDALQQRIASGAPPPPPAAPADTGGDR